MRKNKKKRFIYTKKKRGERGGKEKITHVIKN